MPDCVYVIAQIQVKDLQKYLVEYGLPTFKIFKRFEGEVLAATPAAETLEGEWFGNWTVIVRYPNAERAKEFHECPEYAELKRARIEWLSDGGNLAIVPAFDPKQMRQT